MTSVKGLHKGAALVRCYSHYTCCHLVTSLESTMYVSIVNADDMQLYISVTPNDAAAINSITACLLAINKWMSNNFLKLNEDKTEILLLSPKTKREMLFSNLGKLTLWVKSEVTRRYLRFRSKFQVPHKVV